MSWAWIVSRCQKGWRVARLQQHQLIQSQQKSRNQRNIHIGLSQETHKLGCAHLQDHDYASAAAIAHFLMFSR